MHGGEETVFGNDDVPECDEEDKIFDDLPSRSDYLSAIDVIKTYSKNLNASEMFLLLLYLITDEYLNQNLKPKTQKSILGYFK